MGRRLGVEPGERTLFAWGAVSLLLNGWADVTLKNVAETLFLKRVGVEFLPVAFLVNDALLVVSTYIIGRVAARTSRPRLLTTILIVLALTLFPLWFLVRENVTSAFVVLVIASKQIQSVALLVFWLAMGDLLHGRQAKRMFGPLMAGLTLGTILGSFASDPIARAIGLDGLLPFAAGTLCIAALTTIPLRRLTPARLENRLGISRQSVRATDLAPPVAGLEATRSLARLWRESGLFRLLFLTTLFSGLLSPMLYFQFSYVADLATSGQGGEEKLLALYAWLRGWMNLAILLAQLLAVTRLYRRIGIPLAAALSPVIYLVGFFGLTVRLSLPVGVGAMATNKLQDNAVYDPALRILFNLFPEEWRSRATALLEGPVKRSGGALGNLVILAALSVGTTRAVGFAALPLSALWLGVAGLLWRRYPALLLQVSRRRTPFGDKMDLSGFLDPGTLKVLASHLLDPDPERCAVAIELVLDAEPGVAIGALAAAAREAPPATRPLLIGALDRLLGSSSTPVTRSPLASQALEALLADRATLTAAERATAARTYARVQPRDAGRRPVEDGLPPTLDGILADPVPAVRLAGLGGLCASASQASDANLRGELDRALAEAVHSDDPLLLHVACQELHALLIRPSPMDLEPTVWEARLALLTELLGHAGVRSEAADALADVALCHGERADSSAEAVLAQRDGGDPRIGAAVMRFCGHAKMRDQAAWIVDHVGSENPVLARAAHEAFCAFGSATADVLLVELAFGRRSRRDALLAIIRELELEEATLRTLYEDELRAIRRALVHGYVLSAEDSLEMVKQRLHERVAEGLHSALLLLATIRDESRIAELADLMKRARSGRERAILVEAIEALLEPEDKKQLVPILEEQSPERHGRAAAAALGTALPSVESVTEALLEDPDDLTRILARALRRPREPEALPLARASQVEDHDSVLTPVEIAFHLKSIPMFEGLTTRQLMDLAAVVHEESRAANTRVVDEGDYADCMYLIVDGRIRIEKGETFLAELGPGDFFGEMAVLEGEARSATAVTESRVRLLRLDRDDLLRLMEELPAIAIRVCQTLSRRVREVSGRVHN